METNPHPKQSSPCASAPDPDFGKAARWPWLSRLVRLLAPHKGKGAPFAVTDDAPAKETSPEAVDTGACESGGREPGEENWQRISHYGFTMTR